MSAPIPSSRDLHDLLGAAEVEVVERPPRTAAAAWDLRVGGAARRAYLVSRREAPGEPREPVHPAAIPIERSVPFGPDRALVLCPRPRGVTLASWLLHEPSLPFLEAFLVLGGLAQALAAAHARGVVHGAVEPHLVHWTPPGIALEGLGLAGPDARDAGRDVRAFGLLAHRVLAGVEPDPARPRPVSALRRAVPPGLARLVLRCLRPGARDAPTMAEVSRFFAHLSVPAPSARLRHVAPMAAFLERHPPRPGG